MKGREEIPGFSSFEYNDMTKLPEHIEPLFHRYDHYFAKITESRGKCNQCDDIIQSKHTHDFVTCKCGAFSLDGGLSYIRCLFQNDPSEFTLMTKYRIREQSVLMDMLLKEKDDPLGFGDFEERTKLYDWINENDLFGKELML